MAAKENLRGCSNTGSVGQKTGAGTETNYGAKRTDKNGAVLASKSSAPGMEVEANLSSNLESGVIGRGRAEGRLGKLCNEIEHMGDNVGTNGKSGWVGSTAETPP